MIKELFPPFIFMTLGLLILNDSGAKGQSISEMQLMAVLTFFIVGTTFIGYVAYFKEFNHWYIAVLSIHLSQILGICIFWYLFKHGILKWPEADGQRLLFASIGGFGAYIFTTIGCKIGLKFD